MRIRLKVERTGPTPGQATAGVVDRLDRAMAAVAHDFERAAKLRCPVSGTVKRVRGQRGVLEAQRRIPGRLRASITSRTWRSGARRFGSVGFTEPYGLFLEFGTRAPAVPITPVRKRALAWIGGRPRQVFVRKKSRGGPINVGTAKRPLTFWKAAAERGIKRMQSMPFLRPAWYIDTLAGARERFRRALRKGA